MIVKLSDMQKEALFESSIWIRGMPLKNSELPTGIYCRGWVMFLCHIFPGEKKHKISSIPNLRDAKSSVKGLE